MICLLVVGTVRPVASVLAPTFDSLKPKLQPHSDVSDSMPRLTKTIRLCQNFEF